MSSYGMEFMNGSNIFTIDESSRTFVYLGKYGPLAGATAVRDVDVTCVGFPLVFMSVPYNFTAGDNGANRTGLFVRRIRPLGVNLWRVSIGGCNGSEGLSNISIGTELRVFGLLDLNFPTGSGEQFGAWAWDASGRLTFDSGLRMLRLAGNTYDTEIELHRLAPSLDGAGLGSYTAFDTSVAMPFDLSGKSICAGGRGRIYGYEQIGEYYDPGAGYNVYQYRTWGWVNGYWASGSTLYARKVAEGGEGYLETYGTPISTIDISNLNTVYTRLSVIDNSQFP